MAIFCVQDLFDLDFLRPVNPAGAVLMHRKFRKEALFVPDLPSQALYLAVQKVENVLQSEVPDRLV
jgi:hypothetical protein